MKKVGRFLKVTLQQYLKDCQSPNSKEIYQTIKLPKRATKLSAGYDFYAPFDIELASGQTMLIPTGIKVEMADNYFLAIFPRSGLGFKYRIQLDNTIGIIDADYSQAKNEGHIMIKLTNDGHENKVMKLLTGEGFAQGIFLEYALTDDDEVSEERIGGFGSTTK